MYKVEGRSMEPTLFDGDIIELVSEAYTEGDVVVADVGGKLVVKRVVGDWLRGDNQDLSNDFELAKTGILGRISISTDIPISGHLEKVYAAEILLEDISARVTVTPDLRNGGSPNLTETYSAKIILNTSANEVYLDTYIKFIDGYTLSSYPYERYDFSYIQYKADEMYTGWKHWIFGLTNGYRTYNIGSTTVDAGTRSITRRIPLKKEDIGKHFEFWSRDSIGHTEYGWNFAVSYKNRETKGTTNLGEIFQLRGEVESRWFNSAPTLNISTVNNLLISEGSTFTISGNAIDVDNGNVVTVKYQINKGTGRAAQSGVSNGSTPLSFSKVLTYRGGRLYEGSVDVSGLLAEGTNHTVTIWAEDDQGGKSDVVTRTFTVKHNKTPILTVGTFPAVQSGLIPPDSITLSGTASDPDGNTITVKGKLNSGTEQTVLSGVASGNWLYSFKVSDLKAGANTVTITSTDQFGLSTVKTFNVNNAVTETPMKKSVARYKILAPKGSAREILAWLKREKGNLVVDAEASFVDKGLPEQYTAMTKESVDLTTSISEDELLGAVATAKSDVMFRLTLSRTNTSTNESAVMLVGVIS